MKSDSRYLIILGLILSAGCSGSDGGGDGDQSTQNNANGVPLVAVIDLNVVAQEIGAIDKINFALRDKESQLVEQLTSFESELTQQFKATKQALGMDLNEQQQNDLDRLLSDNKYKISLQQQAAQSQFAAHHAQLKAQFMSQVRPVAYEVAQEQGMTMVLTTSQIYAAGPNVDITQTVIKRIQEINEANPETSAKQPSERVRVAEKLPGGGDFMPQ